MSHSVEPAETSKQEMSAATTEVGDIWDYDSADLCERIEGFLMPAKHRFLVMWELHQHSTVTSPIAI